MPCIALLEALDDAEGVQVVIEAETILLQTAVQCPLPRMAEGWMPYVMDQRESFCEVLIQFQRGCDLPRHLGDLHGVGQAAAEVVGGTAVKNLGLAGEPAKGPGPNDAVPIAVKRTAAVAERRRILPRCQARLF